MSSGDIIQEIGFITGTACTSDYEKWSRKSWSGGNYLPGEPEGTPHAYHKTVQVLDRGVGTRYPGKTYASTELFQKCYGGPSLLEAPWTSSDENLLIGKLLEKIRGHEWHAGNFAGTAAQSARLIGDSARKLASGIRSLKNGSLVPEIVNALRSGVTTPSICVRNPNFPACKRKRRKGNVLDEMSSRWLEASYGWSPLLGDAFAGAEALANFHLNRQTRTFFAKHKTTIEKSTGGYPAIVTTHGRATRKVRICWTLSAELNPLDSLSLTNPAEIVWELMPWSFAIDWFLPIGTWMNNLTFAQRVGGSGFRTEIKKWEGESWSSRPDYFAGKPCKHTIYDFNRTLSGALKVPFPTSINNPFSSLKRLANQIALLAQLR